MDQLNTKCANMENMLENLGTTSQNILQDMGAAYVKLDKSLKKILAKVIEVLSEFGGP